jgi:hypothetical protein
MPLHIIDLEVHLDGFCFLSELLLVPYKVLCVVTGWNGFHQVYREKLLKYYINGLSPFM